MMNNIHIPGDPSSYSVEVLQAYLLEQLPPNQMERIAQDIARFEELNMKVEGIHLLMDTEEGEMGVQQFLEENWVEHKQQIEMFEAVIPTQVSRARRITPVLLAAAVTLLLMVSYLWIAPSSQHAVQSQVMAELQEPFIRGLGRVTRGQQAQTAVVTWQQAYLEQAYVRSAELLEQYENREEQENFYLGLSYLYGKSYSKALEVLENLYRDPNTYQFSEQARWYAALCLIKLDRIVEGGKLLAQIRDGDAQHWKREEAISLLEKLSLMDLD